MKLRLLIFFCTTIFFKTHAQELTIQSSPEFNNPDPANFWTQNLGKDDSGYYLLREIGSVSNPKIILEKYNANFQLLYAKDIETSSGVLGDSKNHFATLFGSNEILVLLASWNKEKMESGLWVQRLSVDGEKVGEEIQLHADRDESLLKSNDYKVAISISGNHLAVLTEPTFDKNAKESFRLSVFNTSNFNKTAEKEFTFSVEMERYPRNEVLVNNNGTAFGFKEVRVSGKEFNYYLASVGANSVFQEEINFGERQLNQSKFIFDDSESLIGAGLLADVKKYNTLWQETWVLKADKNGILKSKIELLGTDLLSNLMREKKAAKAGAAINNFKIKDLLVKPNGGFLLLTEQYDETKTVLPTPPNQPPTHSYKIDVGSIITLSFDHNGIRDWANFFGKRQQFETLNPNIHMGSFAYSITNNKLHFVWNLTEIQSNLNFMKVHWIDKSGDRIAVADVFGEEAVYPVFLTSIDLQNGGFIYANRTFSSVPLNDIQRENNFPMAVDPSIFFSFSDGIVLLSRMKGEMPKKFKFSWVGLE